MPFFETKARNSGVKRLKIRVINESRNRLTSTSEVVKRLKIRPKRGCLKRTSPYLVILILKTARLLLVESFR